MGARCTLAIVRPERLRKCAMLISDVDISAYTTRQETARAALAEPNPALAVRYGLSLTHSLSKPFAALGPPRALSPFSALQGEVCSSSVSSLYVQLICLQIWSTGGSTSGSDVGDPFYDIPPDGPDPPLLCDASGKRPLDAYAPLAYQREPPTVDWGSHVLEPGTTPARATARLGDPVPPGELGANPNYSGDSDPGDPEEQGAVGDLYGFHVLPFDTRFNA